MYGKASATLWKGFIVDPFRMLQIFQSPNSRMNFEAFLRCPSKTSGVWPFIAPLPIGSAPACAGRAAGGPAPPPSPCGGPPPPLPPRLDEEPAPPALPPPKLVPVLLEPPTAEPDVPAGFPPDVVPPVAPDGHPGFPPLVPPLPELLLACGVPPLTTTVVPLLGSFPEPDWLGGIHANPRWKIGMFVVSAVAICGPRVTVVLIWD